VFFFIELGSRRVHIAGCTQHPTSAWVIQQARHMVWALDERTPSIHFLIHDHDAKFTTAFDTVFRAEQMHVIHTRFVHRTPTLLPNAGSERCGGSVSTTYWSSLNRTCGACWANT
jgi:putative transposase